MLKNKIKAGSVVRLKNRKKRAVVKCLLSDIPGGVMLYTPLQNCHYWNVDDLELVVCRNCNGDCNAILKALQTALAL